MARESEGQDMISVVIQSPTVVTVTRSPGAFARLFLGSQERTREAFESGYGSWVYRDNDAFVEPDVDDAIERALTQRAVQARFEGMVRR